jgi:hypothetical protein
MTHVQQELGMSYPTVRARLDEVIQALGYSVPSRTAETSAEDRQLILEQLSRGEITSQEAVALLQGD